MLLASGFFLEDKPPAKLFVFGVISGTIIQPLIADPYLTKRTLVYRPEGWFFRSAPWWIAVMRDSCYSADALLTSAIVGTIIALIFVFYCFVFIE